MKQFNLSEYLENPSRKVVTRDGRPVRIICWDRQCELEYNYPVIALVSVENTETPVISNKEGKTWNNNEINDLFFADEEEGLTEFEKELQIIISEASHWTSDDGSISTCCQFGDKEIKKISKQLLDLTKNKILKDLPKLKNVTHDVDFCMNARLDEYIINDVLTEHGEVKERWVLKKSDLEKLPKEE